MSDILDWKVALAVFLLYIALIVLEVVSETKSWHWLTLLSAAAQGYLFGWVLVRYAYYRKEAQDLKKHLNNNHVE